MFRRVVLLLVIVLVTHTACSSDQVTPAPTPPTPRAPTRYALSGTVTTRNGPVSGVTVEIMDGADRTRLTQTGADGRYRLDGLTPGSFGVRAQLTGYAEDFIRVTLAADGVQDFRITRPLVSYLGSISGEEIPGHQYRMHGSIRNDGDACAQQVRGNVMLAFGGVVVFSGPWNLEASRILRPQETASFELCCIADRYAGQTGTATGTLEYVAVGC